MADRKDKAFFLCFIISAGLTALLVSVGLFQRGMERWWPWLHELVNKRAGVGLIAALVIWLDLWVAFFLTVRWSRTGRERALVRFASEHVSQLDTVSDLDTYLEASLDKVWRLIFAQSELKKRLQLMKARVEDFNRSDRMSFLMMGQAAIESARIESIYGPLRAIVWALPGLGFMGTAVEMSDAIRRVGDVGSGSTDRLLQSLTTGVIPALGGAFQITLFALGSSVLCFVLLSVAHRREEKLLHDADALSLQILARVKDDRPHLRLTDSTSQYLATGLRDLRTVLQVLTFGMHRLDSVLAPSDLADTEKDDDATINPYR